MIDRKALLADLIKQVKAVETDLKQQIKNVDAVRVRMYDEHERATRVGRTGLTRPRWLEERITQAAVAWVLGTVFVRFCEDNLIIPEPYLTGPTVDRRELAESRYDAYVETDDDPTYRGWLEQAFAELGAGQAGKLLFDRKHNPLYQIPISHDGARSLVEFWRRTNKEGELVHDFTDPLSKDGTEGWDTRFLGDLYQDLSEDARKKYALLQTPEFVEEFILDRAMDPAVREFGFEELKIIDPTCGSGHFVLGAFRRLVRLWEDKRPDLDTYDRVRAALDSVHGVDINPFAVAIARFRLLLAAMAVAKMRTLAAANKYDWPIHLAIGDSLIKDRQLQMGLIAKPGERDLDVVTDQKDELADFSYGHEDIHEHKRILEEGRYHVVVGNPPYVAVKDPTLRNLYRELYKSCSGKYALSVPFAERFFQLAKTGGDDGRGYGYIGQITANSFMKREFGKNLINQYFAHKIELIEIIDTSGAYLPGHGTPTVILIGRRRAGDDRTEKILTVRGVQGEPVAPKKAEDGKVWKAIVDQIQQPGSESRNKWVSVGHLRRDRYFGKHPWILLDGGLEVVEQITSASNAELRAKLSRDIGFASFPGQDDAFIDPPESLSLLQSQNKIIKPLIVGDIVRDWHADCTNSAVVPYDDKLEPLPYNEKEFWARYLWSNRRILQSTKDFGGQTQAQLNKPWWAWYRWVAERYRTSLSIAFAEVATHNHFILDRGGRVFKQTAPLIKLPEGASEEEHLRLLGLLNSSTACFWLKMRCHKKGGSPESGGGQSDQPWSWSYQFNGTNVEQFPLPASYPTELATELDRLAQELAATSPSALAASDAPTPTAAALREAKERWERIRRRMIALQEELDWQVYSIYGLHGEDLRAPSDEDVPELKLGERAFEIVLARRVQNGEASTEWFRRHGSEPITELPDHWPDAYKKVVGKRIEAIETSRAIGMVERPEYKRRWLTDGWDALQEQALRSWLLNRIESREFWFELDDMGNEQPKIRTLVQLIALLPRDADFVSVAELYEPRKELAKIVMELVADEHVPFLSALRYKPSGLDKRKEWEHVWDLQRQEDAAPDEPAKRKIRESIPKPPPYKKDDFLKESYWKARGALDVPKERFISYSTTTSGTPNLYGWAGWDHQEQAQALTAHLTDRMQNHAATKEELTPLLAGLLELQPWLHQWHNEFDPLYSGGPDAFFLGYRSQIQGELGLTDDDLRNWRP